MPNWNSVEDRVPCNRRSVWVWGHSIWFVGGERPSKYLGTSKYNPCLSGDGRFDLEHPRNYPFSNQVRVTHWAEIEGPEESESAALEMPQPER